MTNDLPRSGALELLRALNRRRRPLVSTLLLGALFAAGCAADDVGDEPVKREGAPLDASMPGRGSGLLWRLPNGDVRVWDMMSATSYRELTLSPAGLGWQPLATGDFNKDNAGDILWRNSSASQLSIWSLNDTSVVNMSPGTNNAPVLGKVFSGDLDGDGVSDLVWSGSQTVGPPLNLMYIADRWLMSAGSNMPRHTSASASPVERVEGLGNFDGDWGNRADVLYRNVQTGMVSIDFSGGGKFDVGSASLEWQIQGVGDFNGDGASDLLWYHLPSGSVAIWALSATTILENVGPGSSAPAGGWRIQGVGDVDHDGRSDIIWRHSSGSVSIWMMAGPGTVREYGAPLPMAASNQFVGVLDLGPPVAPSALAVGWEAVQNGRTMINVAFDAKRTGDEVEIWDDVGGNLTFRARVPYQQTSGVRQSITFDTAILQNRSTGCFRLKAWEMGRVSPLSSRLCAPGLAAPKPAIEWKVDDLFGFDSNADGAFDLTPSSAALTAARTGRFPLTLDACGSTSGTPITSYDWTVQHPDGQFKVKTASCKVSTKAFPKGSFATTLKVTSQDGRTATTSKTITVKSSLIVSLGDSYASGEGTPIRDAHVDFGSIQLTSNSLRATLPKFTPAFWGTAPDAFCHRTANSGPARAALALERSDPHSSVVFLSTACSGAVIADVMDRGQTITDGDDNVIGTLGNSQIQEVRNNLCPPTGNLTPANCSASQMPKIDALLLSIGGNDVGFSTIVKACTALNFALIGCRDETLVFQPMIEKKMAELPGKLDALDQKLKQLNVASTSITEYPDSVHVDAGTVCDSVVLEGAFGPTADGFIRHDDLVWAASFIGRANTTIATKAQSFGWSFVGGVASKFATHGYCVDSTHFTTRYEESMRIQGDILGTLHPNHAGETAYAEQIVGALIAKGIGSGALPFIPQGRVVPFFAL